MGAELGLKPVTPVWNGSVFTSRLDVYPHAIFFYFKSYFKIIMEMDSHIRGELVVFAGL